MSKRIAATSIVTAFSLFFCLSFSAGAQTSANQSYDYESIDTTIKVNSDSSLDIAETETLNFSGNFHTVWRTIPYNKIDAVTDITVIDLATNQPLVYSPSQLNKLDPRSFGKYTYHKENGNMNIAWYFNLSDTQHSWLIKYKIHGALSFGKAETRLYWNIFTDYTVPVKQSTATVILPQGISPDMVKLFAYRNDSSSLPKIINQKTTAGEYIFSSKTFSPKEPFTIDLSWPAGIVKASAYWNWYVKTHYGYLGAIFSVILSFLAGFIFWLYEEKIKHGQRSIIPQYAPPLNLPPAEAEIIVKEKLSDKGMTATIIDLAVRGYVKIEEEPRPNWIKNLIKIINISLKIILIIFIVFLAYPIFSAPEHRSYDIFSLFPLIFLTLYFSIIFRPLFSKLVPTDYSIVQIKEETNDDNLKNYEKAYLTAIFPKSSKFSTKELRESDNENKIEFHKKIEKLKKEICKETETDSNAFEIGPSQEKIKNILLIVIGVIVFFMLFFVDIMSQSMFLAIAIFLSLSSLWIFIKYEARLSKEGVILKEEWLGFKMYLEVAERYRMQNLTPALFEKYLPYAIIFGVEKKWAKNFETMHIEAPTWYTGNSAYTTGNNSVSSGGFSPTGFSSSFSSSFTSAFATSGASGGAGGAGGGSGGGGGGGGGGGAG